MTGTFDVGIEKLAEHFRFVIAGNREAGGHTIDGAVILLDDPGRFVALLADGLVAKLIHTFGERFNAFAKGASMADPFAQVFAGPLCSSLE